MSHHDESKATSRSNIRRSPSSSPCGPSWIPLAVLWAAVSCGVQAQSGGGAPATVPSSVNLGNIPDGSAGTSGATQASGSSQGTGSSSGGSSGASSGGASGASTGTFSGSSSGGQSVSGSNSGASGSMTQGSGSSTSGSSSTPSEAGTPLSGITVNINGTMVPKEKAIAFIHLGHSNMAGRADTAATVPCPSNDAGTCLTSPLVSRPYFFANPDPHAWMFHLPGQPFAMDNLFQPAAEPYTAGDSGNFMNQIPGQTLPLGGPGTALVKQAVALAPDDYFISLGHGVGSAYCSQFLPGSLYYDKVMAAPLQIKPYVTFGAIVIMLGITERHGTAADITGFSQCINTLVTAIRKDVGVPDLPLLLSDYEMGATDGPDGCLAPTCPFALQIIPQIHMVPSVVSNSALVPTDGLVMLPAPDDHHFNLQGQMVFAQRVLSIMQQKGWFPWQ